MDEQAKIKLAFREREGERGIIEAVQVTNFEVKTFVRTRKIKKKSQKKNKKLKNYKIFWGKQQFWLESKTVNVTYQETKHSASMRVVGQIESALRFCRTLAALDTSPGIER